MHSGIFLPNLVLACLASSLSPSVEVAMIIFQKVTSTEIFINIPCALRKNPAREKLSSRESKKSGQREIKLSGEQKIRHPATLDERDMTLWLPGMHMQKAYLYICSEHGTNSY